MDQAAEQEAMEVHSAIKTTLLEEVRSSIAAFSASSATCRVVDKHRRQ
jgi:hypothetical protein